MASIFIRHPTKQRRQLSTFFLLLLLSVKISLTNSFVLLSHGIRHHGAVLSVTQTRIFSSMESTNEGTTATAAGLVEKNLESVRSRIKQALLQSNRENDTVRLVAVSKTKPASMILEAYNAGQRHFGENYAQELISKSSELPSDIHWHFIGPLQSNKANLLVKNLQAKLKCIETVCTLKLAKKLNNAVGDLQDVDDYKLGIYIQVNTSGEESKSGVSPKDISKLALDIRDECPNLTIDGLMTIGAPGETKDFDVLRDCRKVVCESLGLADESELELSMGMSNDFERAIEKGATSVRVGSTIFGARDYSNKN